MQKIHISLPPTPKPSSDASARSAATRSASRAFSIANLRGNQFDFQHKIMLTEQGAVLQVLGQSSDGNITQADPQNAFALEGQGIKMMLLDTYDDGSEYQLRIELDEALEAYSNTITLGAYFNPQVQIAVVDYEFDGTHHPELDFIGTTDYRYHTQPQALLRPGTWFNLAYTNGNILIHF